MRDLQATFLDMEALIEDDIQIKRPRAPPLPVQIPAQLGLPQREYSTLDTLYGHIHLSHLQAGQHFSGYRIL